MQKLLFEEAWERTISEADRLLIKEAFQQAVLSDLPAIQFSRLWQATNYKDELLITAIIHNVSGNSFSFTKKTIYYRAGEEIAAYHKFTLPVAVKAKTSMPWTFIFPKESIAAGFSQDIGKLEFKQSYDPID